MIMSFQSKCLRAATFGARVYKGDGEDVTHKDSICTGFKSALKSRPVRCKTCVDSQTCAKRLP